MSGFSAIDLDKLPAPAVIEELNFETILSDRKARLIEINPEAEAALQLESDPLLADLEQQAYRELLLRQRINNAAKAVMLPFATGADLDNLAGLFGVVRQMIDAGDSLTQPPVPPTFEDDARLRRRVTLSLEGFSTAGPEGSYIFWGLSAGTQVKDIDASSPNPGEMMITVLSTIGNGTPTQTTVDQVTAILTNDDVRPLTDQVTVQAATITEYTVVATLTLYEGPDGELVRAAAEASVQEYVTSLHKLGHDIILSGLYAALHQPGVQKVVLTSPPADLIIQPNEAAFCTDITVTLGGIDE